MPNQAVAVLHTFIELPGPQPAPLGAQAIALRFPIAGPQLIVDALQLRLILATLLVLSQLL